MLVLIALVVTFGTLLLQGSTLPWLVRRLGLPGPDPLEDRLQEAAVLEQATGAGLRYLGEHLDPDDPDGIGENLRRQVERRTFLAWERLGAAGGHESPNRKQQRLRLGMLAAERAEVLRLRDEAEVPHEVLQSVMAALDVEESVLVRAAEGMDALPDRDDELQAPVGSAGLCEHLAAAPAAVRPVGAGVCSRCVELGWEWVHLRMCLGLRQRRLLRLLARQARGRALRRRRPPGDALGRGRRGVALVLRRRAARLIASAVAPRRREPV